MEMVPETLGVDGTYTNRFVHFPTSQLVLGPHVDVAPTTRSHRPGAGAAAGLRYRRGT